MIFESFINTLLESFGVMTPFHELKRNPIIYMIVFILLWVLSTGIAFTNQYAFQHTVGANILKNTGIEELFNPFHIFIKFGLYISVAYYVIMYIKKNVHIVWNKFEIIRNFMANPTGTTGRRGVLGRCFEQVVEYPIVFSGLVYELQQVDSRAALLRKIAMLSNALKLPLGIWESTVGSFLNRPAIQGAEEMLEEVLPIVAMGLTATKTEIGDISVENFIVNCDRNQRACENIIKRIQPILIKAGIMKDSSYETILSIAKEVNELSTEETWMKTTLKINPNEFLQTEGSVRVADLRVKVTNLRNKLNTLQSKELRSDKVVTECQKHLASLEVLLIEATVLEKANQNRVKPVGVAIQGEKQIGKTNLVQILTKRVCEYVKSNGGVAFRQAPKWTTWSRQCRDEFDTGYTGQEITYVDDAFQQKDNKDHLMWFTFISNTAVGTNQADLKQKGLPYRSKLVFTTCNKLPDKSVTIEDIEALHARFPHTISMVRNKNKMPHKGAIDESYKWVDFYYGPMSRAVAATGSNSTSTMRKVTLDDIVKFVGDDLIIQDRFYNSIIQKQQGIEGQEESLEINYVEEEPVDAYMAQADPLLYKFQAVITNSLGMDMAGASTQEVVQFIKDNLLSFRAWNLISSMQKPQVKKFDEWLDEYMSNSVEGVLDSTSLLTQEKFKTTSLKGLKLCAAKELLSLNKYVELDGVPMASEKEYKQVLDDVQEFIQYELDIFDTDIVDVALAKILLSQLKTIQRTRRESTWMDVGDWIFALKNKITGQEFLEYIEQYPMTLEQFLCDLDSWQVAKPDLFKCIYRQKVICLKIQNNLYIWSPLLKRGTRFAKFDCELMEMLMEAGNQVVWETHRYVGPVINTPIGPIRGRELYERTDHRLQNGFPILQKVHSKLIELIDQSVYRQNTLFSHQKIEILWYALKLRQPSEDLQLRAEKERLQQGIPKFGTVCKTVSDVIARDVEERYSTFKNYYNRLTKDKMHQVLSVLSRMGVPINDYWNDLLTDNAPAITASIVGIITGLLIIVIVKTFQYGIAGEEQSKGEKRAKQKKIATTKMQKLRFNRGQEQAEGDVIKKVEKASAETDSEVIEDLCDYISDYQNIGVFGMNLIQNNTKASLYSVFEETYDFSFTTPQKPEWKKVVSNREDGKRTIEFDIRGEGTVDVALDEIEHLIKVSKTYPGGEWIFEAYLARDGDIVSYHVVLILLNALTQAGLVEWTRAETKNLKNVEIQLNRGSPCDLKAVILGQPQASTQAHDTMEAITNKNFVKVSCLPMESINLLALKGLQVYAIASEKTLILPAHAVREYKWIRFNRIGSTTHFGVAKVDERKVSYQRDIAVANILTRGEAEEIMSKTQRIALTNICNEKFVFPSVAKYLLTNEQSEVEWLDCVTLHYFAKNRTFGLGRTKTYQVDEYECGTEYISKKLVACVQGLQSQVELSQKGDCGSPIVLSTGKRAGKLIGFHSYYSKQKQTWYGSVLTLEDLGIINGQEQHFDDPWNKLIVPGLPTDLPNGPEVSYIGNLVRPSLPVTNSSLDHWHKSPFADQFEEQLAPGRLDPYDSYIEGELPKNREGRKSLVLGPNSEMAKTLPELDQALIDWCVDELVTEQAALFKNQALLTKVSDDIEEAIDYALNGLPDNSYVRGMEINKAAGLPWSFTAPKKSDYIEIEEITGRRSFKNDVLGTALKQRVVLKLQQAKMGNRVLSFSSSKLKDQPIKIAQAKSGRTRVFHCIPVDLIIFTGALYGPYKEAYTKAGLASYHAVGIDPKSVGWMELAAYMTKHPNYFDADYKNYDKYLHRQIFKAVRKIQRTVIQRVQPDKWDTARACEELDAIDTYVVDFQTVYKTNRGNKSGSYTTTIDNCLANDLYGLYAWVKTTGMKSLWEYRQNVSSVAFGDDIIKSVSDTYKDRYNYCTYRDVLNATGHIMTPGSKDGEEKPFTAFENLQFLKRGFKLENGMALAPLLQRSIEGPFVWTDIREDQVTVWVNLIQEQMIEAALWGEEYYTEFCNKLKCGTNRVLNQTLAVLLNTSWEITFQKFCNRYYGSKTRDI